MDSRFGLRTAIALIGASGILLVADPCAAQATTGQSQVRPVGEKKDTTSIPVARKKPPVSSAAPAQVRVRVAPPTPPVKVKPKASADSLPPKKGQPPRLRDSAS
jgi:hypothetical protein